MSLSSLTSICLCILIILGIFLFFYSIVGFAKRNSPASLKIPFIKTEVQGPAWLISIIVAALLVGLPILLSAFQKPNNVTIPPPSVQQVQKIEEPNYKSFRFMRDISILDLRAIEAAPWYNSLPGWKWIEKKPRIKPGILKNYMIVRKVDTADFIHLNYATSGKLDIRCPTHKASFRRSDRINGAKEIETWEVTADVSAVPVGQEFEIMVEATYWNAFAGSDGDDYTTYGHDQHDEENISVIILFPEEKPFKTVTMTDYASEASNGTQVTGSTLNWWGPGNQTFYWSTVARQPDHFYKAAWSW